MSTGEPTRAVCCEAAVALPSGTHAWIHRRLCAKDIPTSRQGLGTPPLCAGLRCVLTSCSSCASKLSMMTAVNSCSMMMDTSTTKLMK